MISQNDSPGGGGPLDTSNKFAVGARNGMVVVLNPAQEMTPVDAAVHGAWLVAISGRKDLFDQAFKEVTKS